MIDTVGRTPVYHWLMDQNPGFWILDYPARPEDQAPCDADLPGHCEVHDFHCVLCWNGTEPGPGGGIELREVFEPDPGWREDESEIDTGPMGDGYEICPSCADKIVGVL